jgi:ubiquinone/menaquinone biosynthesis C-methylase UbiE
VRVRVPDAGVTNPLFARLYARMTENETEEVASHRRELVAGLSGRVIEVGAGNGRNFGLYPPTVTKVVAVEPEPYMRRKAKLAASSARVPIEVVPGLADELPAEAASFDAAVVSLVLCSVPDQATALAEIRRVLVPNGELRFYEHVVSRRAGMSRAQATVDRLFWPRMAGGCHTARDTEAAIRHAGFDIEQCRRLSVKPCFAAIVVAPHILGAARPTRD